MRFQLILMAAAGALWAQQEPTFRADAQQVLVPVVVTDAKGRHVSGLRAGDFQIFEDGVAQTIASFTVESANSVDDVGALARSEGPGAPRHTFVICIDTLHATAASAARTRQALEKLFDKTKAGSAQYVLIGIGRQLQVLEAATANPLAVMQRLRGAGFESAITGQDAPVLEGQLQSLRRRMEEFCKRCACGARSKQQPCDSDTDALRQAADAEAERWKAPTAAMLDQFRSVLEELAKLPTGRTLILISDGFHLDPRREFYNVMTPYLPGATQFHLDDSASLAAALRPSLEIAAGRNITIDAIDTRTGALAPQTGPKSMDAGDSGATPNNYSVLGTNRGNRSSSQAPLESTGEQAPSHVAIEESAPMEQLAKGTGGIHFHSGGDLLNQLRGALTDGREYYLVAYAPKNSARDGAFRSIRVEVANKSLTVRAKPGYWAQ